MPECPEIANLAKQLHNILPGKTISKVENHQEKSLNMTLEDLQKELISNEIVSVDAKGKWLRVSMQNGDYLALNLGMGGEIYYSLDHSKVNTKLTFSDQSTLVISFWWFGHVDYVKKDQHHTIDELGYDLINEETAIEDFVDFLQTQRGRIKNVLLDQRKIAGIGNYYIHDILFDARIHPQSTTKDLPHKRMKELYQAIKRTFEEAISCRGSFYEQDIYGKKGTYKANKVAYKEGEPCPECQTNIIKMKTGSTTSYLCPSCQKSA